MYWLYVTSPKMLPLLHPTVVLLVLDVDEDVVDVVVVVVVELVVGDVVVVGVVVDSGVVDVEDVEVVGVVLVVGVVDTAVVVACVHRNAKVAGDGKASKVFARY